MSATSQPAGSEPQSRFIGRIAELEVLEAALRGAVAGQPRVVLLTGEPGIGKTRTAQEIVERAAKAEVLALWGRCPEEPGAPPYWPWLQLIRRYAARHADEMLSEVLGPAAPHIATLDPDLARALGQRADAPAQSDAGDAVKARFLLFDAIAGFWRRACAVQPLMLVLDDLHRADVPSLRLLEFVVAEAGDSRLMVLGTYRDFEVTRQHPLSDTLAQLPRHAPVRRLLLGGFSAAESARFVAAAGVASGELAAALHEQTEGHPLFLAELARDLAQARQQRPGAAAAVADGAARRVPKGVRDVIGARLNRLTPACVGVLQQAAVIGREFRLDLLCDVLGEASREAVLAAIDEAQTASVVDQAPLAGAWQFAHALIRDTLYDELPPLRRARLHQHIAATLEHRHAGDLTPHLSALAYHCHAAGPAGDVARAIEYATRAAERATAMQAHEEAVRHYRAALDALPAAPATEAQRGRLLLGLGNAQNSVGDSSLALVSFTWAADCARRADDRSLLVGAAVGFGDTQWRLGIEGSPAAALIREALARMPPGESRERALLLSTLCQALLFSNQPDEAEAAFRQAVALARRLGDPSSLFRALCAILPGRWFQDRLMLRIAAAREALVVAQRAGHPEWAAPYLAGWHSGDLMELGETAQAAATSRFHLTTGQTMREPFNEAVAGAALAMIAAHEGRFDEAEALAGQALRSGSRLDVANAAGIFGVQMFTIRRQQGRLAELAPVLRQFLATESQAGTWLPGLAVLHCELGAEADARAVFDKVAGDGFAAIPNDALRIASLAYLAEACAWLNDSARAAELYELLLPYAERNIVLGAHTASFGAGARLLGTLAATLGRWDDAARHFEFALEFDARTGGRPWLARSRCEFAAMLLRRSRTGDDERALGLLAAALDDARQLGMQGLQQRALALQQRASVPAVGPAAGVAAGVAADEAADELVAEPTGEPTSSRAREVFPAGLSAREVQVLQLVAAGMTNQQIADKLCRSPSTVAIHVRNILGKTHAANRAEAAAFAVRHRLVPPE